MSGSRPESAVVGVLVDDERTIGGVEKDSFAEGKEQVTGEKTDVPGELLDYVDVVTPDGGLRAWLVVLASTCATFATFGFVNAWGVFQEYYQHTLLHDHSPSDIAWIGSVQYAFIFMFGLPMGRWFDAGYHNLPIGIASAILVTATFLVGECTKYWHFLLCQGFCVGLSCGFIMGPSVSVIPQWFKHKKGAAFGLVALGSSCGGVAFPIAARKLIPEVGFPWTMRILGFMQLGVLAVTNLATRRNFPPRKDQARLTLAPFESFAFSLYCLAGFVTFLGLYTVLTYIDGSAQLAGMQSDFSFYLVAVANAGSSVGRIGGGITADKTGPLNVIIPSTLVAGVATYAWPYAASKDAFVVVALIYGAASGVFVSLFVTPLLEMGGLHDFGTRSGYFLTVISFGALAGPPISGAINRQTQNFDMVGVYAGTSVVVAVALMIIVRQLVLRQVWGKV